MKLLELNGKFISLSNKLLLSPDAVDPPPSSGPEADFVIQPGTLGEAPFSISVSSTSNGEALTHLWDWGDGSPTENGWDQVLHTYTSAGEYDITLLVTQTTDNTTDTKTIRVTVSEAVSPTNTPPTPPGKPELISANESGIELSFPLGSDDVAVSSYDIYRYKDISLIPQSDTYFELFDVLSEDLNSQNNLIRSVFDLPAGQSGPNGIPLFMQIESGYPSQVDHRQELRETDIGFIPQLGTTIEYNTRFKAEVIPSIIYEPITIMQLFDHGAGAPRVNVLLTGANQFSATGDENLIQIFDSYSNTREKFEGVYLKEQNDLKLIVHFQNGSGGYIALFLNGEMLYSKQGINTSPSGGTALQFGIYPHGFIDSPAGRVQQENGEDTIALIMESFSKRIFPGAAVIAGFDSFDFNAPANTSASGSPYLDTGLEPSTRYRYALRSRDGGNLLSAPSLSSSFATAASSGGGGGNSNATLIKETNFPASAQYINKDAWKNGWDAHGLGRYNFSGAQFTSSPITISNGILKIPFKQGDWGGAAWQNTGAIIYQSQPRFTGKKIYWKFPVKFSSNFDWGSQGEQYRGGKFGLSITVGSVGVGSNPGWGNYQMTTMWRGGGIMHNYLYWQGMSGNWPDNEYYHTIPKGSWLDFEVEISNNDPGQSNAYVKIWIDGVQRLNKTGIQFGPGGTVSYQMAFGSFFGGNSSAWQARNDCDIEYGKMEVWDERP